MATVIVYRRHSQACKYTDERFHRGCDCPCWLEYMHNRHQVRKSARTRSWDRANKDARSLEIELEAAERGETPEKKAAPRIAVEDAISRYLADKKTGGI